ncbi:hypothetical protein DYB25_004275 [Aphanomyces astaci]|uniref:WRKY19-like zinc finger domain-containing protein n=2 Tax=Aphanomyces astaci TaxID=112090 RepID=A0A397DTU7_APHAT|nr:hypothetical protein DYB36_004615 [Aphanomyces astaci]RHY12212.1 hypothetical protein DYB25_004275 [Aphanomyces astaci]RHY58687.1 hypothetical protein DYB38_001415 [Aphanomyces astaci]RHY67891.1 hypothetical protein DYB30_002122 [Aphanomyces astaci]RHY85659.1 hypothetical protein DYB26_006899 [Aphanomyces astaci]
MLLHRMPHSTLAPSAMVPALDDAVSYCAASPCYRFAKDSGLCLFHAATIQQHATSLRQYRLSSATMSLQTPPLSSVITTPRRYHDLTSYLPSQSSSGRSSPHSDIVRVSRKLCQVEQCTKRAKSGGLCISHGGGKRCDVDGCVKSAKERGFCISHGGGKRCLGERCNKSALLGGFCAHHGGGRRCGNDGCTKYALSGGFCIAHGGGKRCNFHACPKSAVSGGYCVAHGGGHRCATAGCMKGAVTGGLCIKHGGGKKCLQTACRKNARTKGYCFTHFKAMEALVDGHEDEGDDGGVVEL